MFKELFAKAVAGQSLTTDESKQAFDEMVGEWEPSQTGAFLTAMHVKGETPEEIAGFASAMKEKSIAVPINGLKTLDTCGTGGDRKDSFNISTAAAFVLAGCGIPVAKHGNRAASSLCGSADLLQALGIRYRLQPDEAAAALNEFSFAFLFAPDYHPLLKSVGPIRRQLGIATLFNLLGPLTNPAGPAAQMIGVYTQSALPLMAQAIPLLDADRRAVLIHSEDGHDEATPCCRFLVREVGTELFAGPSATAADFGIEGCMVEDLRGGSPSTNAQIILDVLNGKRIPARNAVTLNAVIGYRVYYPNASAAKALTSVEESIDSGAAREVVARLAERFHFEDNP